MTKERPLIAYLNEETGEWKLRIDYEAEAKLNFKSKTEEVLKEEKQEPEIKAHGYKTDEAFDFFSKLRKNGLLSS